MLTWLGARVSCKRSYLRPTSSSFAVKDESISGTCEAYSPSTNAYLVVFDDPLESLLSSPSKTDDGAEFNRPRKGISIAILDTDDYLTYEDCPETRNNLFGGKTVIKSGKSRQLSCAWFAKWIPAQDFSKRTREERDEPLLCLCRRIETAEPPPPNFNRKEEEDDGEDEVYLASKLIECDKCKEWFHSECVERACKVSSEGQFTCPLCTGILFPPGFKSLTAGSRAGNWVEHGHLSKQRRETWLDHSSAQRVWRDNSLFEWQYWTRSSHHHQGEGMWVLCLATLRRFVGQKLKKMQQAWANTTTGAGGGGLDAVSLMLNMPIEASTGDMNKFMTSLDSRSKQAAAVVAAVAALASPPASLPPPTPVLPVPLPAPPRERTPLPRLPEDFPACTRIRTFDEHLLFAKSKRYKMKSHEVSNTINSAIENLSSFGKKRHLRFAKSLIQGWGVFTEEPIPAGEFVIEYKGEIVSKAEAEIRFAKYTAQGMPDYLFTLDSTQICDATMRGSMARFVNHSCDPNCYSTIVSHSGRKKIGIFALRDIKVGEELCYDYKFQEDADVNNKLKCMCGAKNCKGVLN